MYTGFHKGVSSIFSKRLTVSRWNFRGVIRGIFNRAKGNMDILLLLSILLLLPSLLQLIQYYCCYCCSYYYHYHYHTSTIKAKRMKMKIWQNIEGKFELNQKKLCASRLSKGRISRMDLGIKLELSENALSKEYISNIISTANCIKFKLPGLDEGNVQLTFRQCVNTTTTINIVLLLLILLLALLVLILLLWLLLQLCLRVWR